MKRIFSLFLAALFVALFLSAGCGGAATQPETKGFEPKMTAEEAIKAGCRLLKEWQQTWVTKLRLLMISAAAPMIVLKSLTRSRRICQS